MTTKPPPERSVLGRAVVLSVYSAVAVYVVVVIVGGLVAGLYGKPPSPGEGGKLTEKEQAWCSRTLVALRDELDSQVAVELERPARNGDPERRWNRFQEHWLEAFTPAQSRCGVEADSALTKAFLQLGALDRAYADVITRLTQARSSVATRLNATVDQWRLRP